MIYLDITSMTSISRQHLIASLVHVLALVVAPRHEEVVRVEQLEPEEDEDALDRERAPVDEVAVEEVRVVSRRKAVQFENV